jgi:hypothetical protein
VLRNDKKMDAKVSDAKEHFVGGISAVRVRDRRDRLRGERRVVVVRT